MTNERTTEEAAAFRDANACLQRANTALGKKRVALALQHAEDAIDTLVQAGLAEDAKAARLIRKARRLLGGDE